MKMMSVDPKHRWDPHWRTQCPKCRSERIRVTYRGKNAKWRDSFREPTVDCISDCPFEEHFHCTCDQCLYEWTTEGPFKEIKDDGDEDSKS